MGKDLSGLRAIAARRSGMQCHYCSVPTAAEIEHLRPRSEGGSSWMDNLVLSCPYCNKKKGTRDLNEFLASEDWKLPSEKIPEDPAEMLLQIYGWTGNGYLPTASRNARLLVQDGSYFLEIRPGKRYPWRSLPVRGERTSLALRTFLRRHFAKEA